MEGHQRAIMGNMTVEEIYRDRQTFSTRSPPPHPPLPPPTSCSSSSFSSFSSSSLPALSSSSTRVFDVASADLYNMGIMVASYTIKDVSNEVGYLASLGQAR